MRLSSSILPAVLERFKLKCQISYLSTYANSEGINHQTDRDPKVREKFTPEEIEQFRRRRKIEWKRRQSGQTFLDHVIINVRGGTGGNGCAAFHREKFIANGPPSGGNGGRGGDVYILPTPHLTTLSTLATRIRAENGGNGQGSWQNGKAAPPLVIKVPLGTVVRELPRGDHRRAKDEWEVEEEAMQGLTPAEKQEKMRMRRWMHYPGYDESNSDRESFMEAETELYKQERQRRYVRRKRELENPIYLDLDKVDTFERPVDAPLGTKHKEYLGHLIASGGAGGHGNPHFVSKENRSPKFASRGQHGERVTLSLELKILADIGLVGMPNAGKSTLLRALTGGRVKSEIASYAFTTLNPVVGIVRVSEDGTFEGSLSNNLVHRETLLERQEEKERMENGDYAHALTRNQIAQEDKDQISGTQYPGHLFDIVEAFRFTIADNPGLISRASENVGLGHSFLRSMERSLALVYVVDLSESAPWDELAILRDELEKYQPGMSTKARMVVANKADLLGGEDPVAVEEAQEKLRKLKEFVANEMVLPDGRQLDVVPVSAMFSQNLNQVVRLMQGYIQAARDHHDEV